MEWKTVKLGEIGTVVGGATPLTKNAAFYDGDIAWITPKDLANHSHRYISRGERNITEDGFRSCSCKMMPKGSILFSSRAPIGYIAIAENDLCTNQGFKSIIPDADKIDNIFLFYLLNYHKDYIAGLGSGTTFMEVSGSVMKNIEVKIPSLKTQRRIATILSSLDDKIENNNRINRNLEAQAQALFKSWFVDFEPFNDSKLVESELGFIPAKWHIESFSSLINFQEGPGIRNWQYVTENGTKFINIRCIKDGDIFTETANMISNEEANGKYAHFMLREGDIVMSCSGTLGRYAIVRKDHLPLCLNTSVIRFFPIYKNDYSYIWGLLTSSYFLNKQIEMAAGSVQANFGPTHLKQIKILVPDEINREQFNKICYPILFEIQRRRYENKRLATLRDTLLPKLMRGEIEVA